MNPHPYPINATFHPNRIPDFESSSNGKVGDGGFGVSLQDFDNGRPHNPKFPSSIKERNIKSTNSSGIFPTNSFDERSSHSSWVKFPSDGGISPPILLLERLSPLSALSFPKTSGITPSKLLLERSMLVNMVKILTSCIVNPFIVKVSE
ncbi:hypothetical protein QQP08_017870 [Theobroma cacao]|nr:hypothetical protein QQP08_017870 [Theobroma cacao]